VAVVVDQREIQKIGGKAALYPSSYIVYSILSRHNLFNNVLDVTYGRGRFYAYAKPKLLVGADPKVWEWIVAPDVFIPRPVWALKPVLEKMGIRFDVVVCDPPQWQEGVHYHARDEYRYVVGSVKMIIESTFRLAKDIGVKYVLLHFNRLIDGYRVVEDVQFRYVARYMNNEEMMTTHFTLYEVE